MILTCHHSLISTILAITDDIGVTQVWGRTAGNTSGNIRIATSGEQTLLIIAVSSNRLIERVFAVVTLPLLTCPPQT